MDDCPCVETFECVCSREALAITPPRKSLSSKQSRKRKRSKEDVSNIEIGQYHRKLFTYFLVCCALQICSISMDEMGLLKVV